MNSLFDGNHRYTSDAQDLDSEAGRLLGPLFNAYLARGYSPREIFLILIHTCRDLELEALLGKPEVEGSLASTIPQQIEGPKEKE